MARQTNAELDPLISQYQHESSRPRASEALFMLRKIGSLVKPIMRQRMWRVGTLAEFYPAEANLLGLNTNRGQKINLRLRYPGDANQFLPLEQVVDTMLHELCHNEIGPHNAEFHALWDQLRDEHESLIRKGYTGEGFLGRGQHLGGRKMPLHEATRLARQAAEQRRQREKMMSRSGQRLGGSGILRGQDARQIIADVVERRNKIERGCASGTAVGDQVAESEFTKQEGVTTTSAGRENEDEATMMQAYIDLIQEEEREKFGGDYEPPSAANPAGPRGGKGRKLVDRQREIEAQITSRKDNGVGRSTTASPLNGPRTPQDSKSRTVTPQPASSIPSASPPMHDTWTCEICTLINPISYLACEACTIERPAWISKLQDGQSPSDSTSRPTMNGTSRSSPFNRETPNALKPRQNAYDSISRFEAERTAKVNSALIGWICVSCGNFMENEWWTCSACGKMKQNS